MTYSFTIDSPHWALSANRLLPRRWQFYESTATRYLSEPQVSPRFLPAPVETHLAPTIWEIQRPHSWLNSALKHLSALADLKPGWDDATAPPIDPALASTVWNFLNSDLVSSLEVSPDLVPTFDGGLLIEWHTVAVDLIIEAGPDGAGSFYFCDNETHDEIEAPLGERLDALATAFTKLGMRL